MPAKIPQAEITPWDLASKSYSQIWKPKRLNLQLWTKFRKLMKSIMNKINQIISKIEHLGICFRIMTLKTNRILKMQFILRPLKKFDIMIWYSDNNPSFIIGLIILEIFHGACDPIVIQIKKVMYLVKRRLFFLFLFYILILRLHVNRTRWLALNENLLPRHHLNFKKCMLCCLFFCSFDSFFQHFFFFRLFRIRDLDLFVICWKILLFLFVFFLRITKIIFPFSIKTSYLFYIFTTF